MRQPSGEWKLAIYKRHFIERNKQRAETPTNITLLLQASREDRLAAVAKIPTLLAAVFAKASEAVERVEGALRPTTSGRVSCRQDTCSAETAASPKQIPFAGETA